jgi:hypothetical protein
VYRISQQSWQHELRSSTPLMRRTRSDKILG